MSTLNILMFSILSMLNGSIFRTYAIFSLKGCAEVALVVTIFIFFELLYGDFEN